MYIFNKIKIAGLLIIFLTSTAFQANIISNPNSIIWDANNPLKWLYFQGKPNLNDGVVALTSYSIFNEMETIGENNDSALITIYTAFNKQQSWKQSENLSADVLAHEQLHFDIAEYYSRLLKSKIAQKKYSKRKLGNEINAEYQKCLAECEKEQFLYDSETIHGIKISIQNIWRKKYDGLLIEVEKFKAPTIEILLN